MKATLSRARIAPKKLNLVAGLVRTKKVSEALDLLAFTPKKGARILRKVLVSAVSNAENNYAQDRAKLVVRSILVNEGPTLKRWIPIARGSSHPIRKRNTHITVEVGLDEGLLHPSRADEKKAPPSATSPSADSSKPSRVVTRKSVKKDSSSMAKSVSGDKKKSAKISSIKKTPVAKTQKTV